MKCFYHNADLDGKCSAAIVRRKYPDIELIGINYGDPFPWEDINQAETIYMVDFSLQPFEDMLKLIDRCGMLVWIDHHKTAIEEYEKAGSPGGLQGYLKIGIGACALCWGHLFPNESMPEGVRLLAEYDVWDHSDPRCLPYQHAIRNSVNEPDAPIWNMVFSGDCFQAAIDQGKTILTWEERQNEIRARSMCFDTELDGLKCIAANIGLTNSKLFDSVWDPEKYDAMLTFHWRKGRWTISLYSTGADVDVGAICKARGGGGHKGAAGFQTDEIPFEMK